MHWLGYIVGLIVGTTFGVWLQRFWEHDLEGLGSSPLPSVDPIVPLVLLILGAVMLGVLNRRRRSSPPATKSDVP